MTVRPALRAIRRCCPGADLCCTAALRPAAACCSAFISPIARRLCRARAARRWTADLSRRTPSSASTATGKVTLVMPQVEMGQGVYTSLSMILAEELDAAFGKRDGRSRAAERRAVRQSTSLGIQATGNSNSVRAFWKPLAQGRRGARAMLVASGRARNGTSIRHLHDGQQRSDPSCERAQAGLWRARRCGSEARAAGRSAAQGSERLQADRQDRSSGSTRPTRSTAKRSTASTCCRRA